MKCVFDKKLKLTFSKLYVKSRGGGGGQMPCLCLLRASMSYYSRFGFSFKRTICIHVKISTDEYITIRFISFSSCKQLIFKSFIQLLTQFPPTIRLQHFQHIFFPIDIYHFVWVFFDFVPPTISTGKFPPIWVRLRFSPLPSDLYCCSDSVFVFPAAQHSRSLPFDRIGNALLISIFCFQR